MMLRPIALERGRGGDALARLAALKRGGCAHRGAAPRAARARVGGAARRGARDCRPAREAQGLRPAARRNCCVPSRTPTARPARPGRGRRRPACLLAPPARGGTHPSPRRVRGRAELPRPGGGPRGRRDRREESREALGAAARRATRGAGCPTPSRSSSSPSVGWHGTARTTPPTRSGWCERESSARPRMLLRGQPCARRRLAHARGAGRDARPPRTRLCGQRAPCRGVEAGTGGARAGCGTAVTVYGRARLHN